MNTPFHPQRLPDRIDSSRFSLLFVLLYTTIFIVIQAVDVSRFIADDSYFYMTIARNIALHGQQTFSGTMPTNGAHPLWLYLLSASNWVFSLINPAWLNQPYVTVIVSWALIYAAAVIGWRSAKAWGLHLLLFPALPIGFVCAFNLVGSEAYLYYCCLSLLCLLSSSANKNWIYAAATGLAAAAVFLARLDSVFFVFAFLCWQWTVYTNKRWASLMLVMAGLPITIYLLSNLYFFNGIVPVSGWLKSTFPMPDLKGFGYARLGTEFLGYNLIFGIFPLLGATLLLPWLKKRLESPKHIFYILWIGSLMHFGYQSLFTRSGSWLWYYILPVQLGALALALSAKYLLKPPRQSQVVLLVSSLAICLTAGYALRTAFRPITWEEQGTRMLTYLAENKITDAVVIVGDSPGETAFYSSNNHVIALDMLTANRSFIEEMTGAENGFQFLLDHAAQAGKPIYLLYTTGTWLGQITTQDDATLSYWFLIPGQTKPQLMGSVSIGPPLYKHEYLTVWRISP